jgi:ubiquinone/menaquinone biosynthesis C-methylase UbiE
MGEEVMASLEKVSRQYRGKMASGYDEKRLRQKRWHEENRIVEEMLTSIKLPGDLIDCPVGTGRFLPMYDKMKITGVGIDSSEEMLSVARTKLSRKQKTTFAIEQGSADKLRFLDREFRTCVCVRFFNLVEPDALKKCFAELSRVTSEHMICTVRLGEEYYSNSAMATHEERAWWRMVKKHGWQVVRDETEPFVKGWNLMHLRKP